MTQEGSQSPVLVAGMVPVMVGAPAYWVVECRVAELEGPYCFQGPFPSWLLGVKSSLVAVSVQSAFAGFLAGRRSLECSSTSS